MAHARQRNKTWQARWRLRNGKEASHDGFPTKKAAEAFGYQQEQLEKRFKNTKFDVTGRVVMTETKTLNNGENNLEFNTANVTNGMYILELRTAEKSYNTKIVIAK